MRDPRLIAVVEFDFVNGKCLNPRLIYRKDNAVFKAKLVITQDDEQFWDTNWYNIKDPVDFQEAIATALFALGRKKSAERAAAVKPE